MNQDFNHNEDPKFSHHDELKSINSFKVPELYFDSLTERIMDRVEKESLPSVLKENSFKVPIGYFENLNDKILEKVLTGVKTKNIRTRFINWKLYSVAAIFLLVCSLFLVQFFNAQKQVDYLANTTEEELLEYVSLYISDFNQESLASITSEDDIRSLEIIDEMDTETSDLLIELFE